MQKHFDKTQRRQKGFSFLAIIIAVAFVIVAAVGGYYAYQYFATKTQPVVQTQQNQNQNTPPTTTPTTQTAGWKTYTNNNLGISINYPSLWTYQEYSCNIDGVAFCPQKSGATGCGQTCSMNSPSSPIYFVTDMWNNSKDKQKSFLLSDAKYQDIYNQMLSTFKFNPTAGVTLDQIENATYEVRDMVTMAGTELVNLKNSTSQYMKVTLQNQDVIYGDLNGDGINDAIVLLNAKKDTASENVLELVLNINGSIKTFMCSGGGASNFSDYSVKNGLVIDSNKNDVFPVGNLREAYKFVSGHGCVSGDIDITNGKTNFPF